MSIFNKRKKENDQAYMNDNAEIDIFDKVFSNADEQIQREMENAIRNQDINSGVSISTPINQPQTIKNNHKDFISDFDKIIGESLTINPVPQKTKEINPSIYSQTTFTENSSSIIGISSIIGKRDSQQDAVAVSNQNIASLTDQKLMAVLCDGMGGMNGGERASQLCINDMLECYSKIGTTPVPQFFHESIIKTDYDVAMLQDENGNYLGGGSTLVSVIFDNGNLYWASVGDSHIYIIRGKEMIRVNAEHNYLMELMQQVKTGQITREQALADKNKEALISYMGMGNVSLIDINEKPFILNKNDFVVLCSDGLYRSVTDNEIYTTVIQNNDNMQKAAIDLTNLAMSKGKKYQDNTTVVAIRYI